MKRGVHAVAWVLLAVAAFLLWPERWGGSMTYVITSGNSMAPTWEAGDLAVLRATDQYRVGDVAAYDSAELKTIVMHRITKESAKGYTFQGDNNDFLDPETVTEQQMLGELVLRVPGVGRYLTWFVKPINLAIAAAALFLLFGDRRKEREAPAGPVPAADPLVLAVTDFHVPPGAVVADLVDERDLQRVAARYDRPVLRDEAGGRSWVHDGAMVYRHQAAVGVAPEVGTGRDWQYGVDAEVIALLPRPRRQAQEVPDGLRLGKLLRLG